MHFSFHGLLNLRNPETFPNRPKLDHIWETRKPVQTPDQTLQIDAELISQIPLQITQFV